MTPATQHYCQPATQTHSQSATQHHSQTAAQTATHPPTRTINQPPSHTATHSDMQPVSRPALASPPDIQPVTYLSLQLTRKLVIRPANELSNNYPVRQSAHQPARKSASQPAIPLSSKQTHEPANKSASQQRSQPAGLDKGVFKLLTEKECFGGGGVDGHSEVQREGKWGGDGAECRECRYM